MDPKAFANDRRRPWPRARSTFRRCCQPRWTRLAVERMENRLLLSMTALASFAPGDGNLPVVFNSNAPSGGIVLDRSGNLFGVLPQGGTHQDGSVYELPAGADTITTLASFDGADGKSPNGSLVVDANGNLYGATSAGGANNDGTVFEIAAGSGTITTLASFDGSVDGGGDGTAPNGLVMDSVGNLYGTTRGGGGDNAGVVFVVVHGSGAITPVASFDGSDGMAPNGLVMDSEGNLYGTTAFGGANHFGVVFEVARATGTLSILASFDGGNAFTNGSLAVDNGGNLYGATDDGVGGGAVFEVAKGSGTISVLDSLASTPTGDLVVDNRGNVYGATAANRSGIDPINPGVIFEIAQGSGQVTTLDRFDGAMGSGANAGLAIDSRGNLYGTTADGGASGDGVIFEFSASPYVTAVYQDVLGRAPDANGLAFWSQKLTSGTPRADVAESIVKSDEYYQNFVIKPDYLKILGRAADSDGLSFWTKKMEAGATDQQLAADLAASDEVYAKAGGSNRAWIDSVFHSLLNRAADAGGETYWVGRLAAGVSRSDVAQGIANSQENNTQLINDDYFHYLGRAADARGLAFWLSQFAQGQTNEEVIAGFTGSDEYYNRHMG